MALRRSRVRIPLGPQLIRPHRSLRPVRSERKVITGVVSHLVSELGEKGGSPAWMSNENIIKAELACCSQERLEW
jgi:hypothetical protein